jgi:hypothetical protein
MVIKNKKTSTRQEVIITATMLAITTAVIALISNSLLEQEIRKESLAAAGIQPDNTEKAGLSSVTNIIKNTASANHTFWINTVRIDGNANINGDSKVIYLPEKFPNSSLPVGGGLVLTPPDSTGDWSIRSFTFEPSMIVVHQGDRVILHFVGVQGPHHIITISGIGTFPLDRGQIHTVTFIANQTGTMNYYCHTHMPNMVGHILVLPRITP